MSQVLIIDNSKWLASMAAKRMDAELNLSVRTALSYSDAAKQITRENSDFLVAVTGLYLEDAPEYAIVDLILSKNIPTIVYTAEFNDRVRKNILSKNVIDYVLKEDARSLDHVISLVRRIIRNQSVSILVVDDSPSVRKRICELLKVHQYNVFEACDGHEADRVLNAHPDVRMVITDYCMPNMDGFELTKNIRDRFSEKEIAVIGISGHGCEGLSARFIKTGADDFLDKPFHTEDFYSRITRSIEMVEYIEKIKDSSGKDDLTGLHDNKYVSELGAILHENLAKKESMFSVALIEIDHFQQLNDRYGHRVGEMVLKKVSMILRNYFGHPDIVARFGKDKFCILLTKPNLERMLNTLELLRKYVEVSVMNVKDREIRVTVSIGACASVLSTFEMMIRQSEIMLHEARSEEGNRVVCLSDEGIVTV